MISIPVPYCMICPFFMHTYSSCWIPAKVRDGPDPVPASVTQAIDSDRSLRRIEDPRGLPPKWCPLRCSPAVVFLVPAERTA